MGKLLIGEYSHGIDAKGRMIFPAKLREGLGEVFYVTKGLESCLYVYSEAEWLRVEQRIREMPMARARELQRFLFSSAAQAEPDRQGRILLPAALREYAGLRKDVMVIGASVRAEIWDRERWVDNSLKMTPESIAAAMDELGF